MQLPILIQAECLQVVLLGGGVGGQRDHNISGFLGGQLILKRQGDGKGHLEPVALLHSGVNPHGLSVGDFNADGVDDLAVVNRSTKDLVIFLGDAKGKFKLYRKFPLGADVITLAANDFDGDGILDLALVVASADRLRIFRGLGNGSFNPFPLQQDARGSGGE